MYGHERQKILDYLAELSINDHPTSRGNGRRKCIIFIDKKPHINVPKVGVNMKMLKMKSPR